MKEAIEASTIVPSVVVENEQNSDVSPLTGTSSIARTSN
jgi:hypothetical protein